MRYLKTYESNNSTELEEIKKTIEEICYDITDDGFKFLIDNTYLNRDITDSNISASLNYVSIFYPNIKGYSSYSYSEVKEVVDRVKNYLGDRVINCKVRGNINGKHGWYKIRNITSEEHQGYVKIDCVIIVFK